MHSDWLKVFIHNKWITWLDLYIKGSKSITISCDHIICNSNAKTRQTKIVEGTNLTDDDIMILNCLAVLEFQHLVSSLFSFFIIFLRV